MNLTSVNVRTPQTIYPIHIGEKLAIIDYLKTLQYSTMHIVTDNIIYDLHGKKFEAQLKESQNYR